jgi:hypothetical protein
MGKGHPSQHRWQLQDRASKLPAPPSHADYSMLGYLTTEQLVNSYKNDYLQHHPVPKVMVDSYRSSSKLSQFSRSSDCKTARSQDDESEEPIPYMSLDGWIR